MFHSSVSWRMVTSPAARGVPPERPFLCPGTPPAGISHTGGARLHGRWAASYWGIRKTGTGVPAEVALHGWFPPATAVVLLGVVTVLLILTASDAVYSRIVARRASTSSMMGSGTVSILLPLRAPRSSTRGWSQRITPVVRVPTPSRETANPRLRAKLPPVVIGRTTGTPVSLLKASGETISTGRVPCCSDQQRGRD